MKQITTIKDLDETLIEWSDNHQNQPNICRSFYDALYHLVTYVDLSLDGLSKQSKKNNANLKNMNQQLKKDGSTTKIFSIHSDIVSRFIIPELYSFSLVGGWGLLEEFLTDIPFYIISESISSKQPPDYLKIKKFDIKSKELALHSIAKAKNNLQELIKIYKDLLDIELKKNAHFIELEKLRQKRHKIAHTGTLLGYNSLTRNIFWNDEKFEDQLGSISRRAGEEFTDVKKTFDEKGNPTLNIVWHPYDPVEAKTSKELEHDFCSTIIHMWKLCDFLFDKLFFETKHSRAIIQNFSIDFCI